MDKLFLADAGKHYSYRQLVTEVKRRVSYCPLVLVPHNEPFELLVRIVHSLLHCYPIELLDGDFSPAELHALGVTSQQLLEQRPVTDLLQLEHREELLARMREANEWNVSLYTSGTGGAPRKVTQSLPQLMRSVRLGERHETDVWALAYNPTHMAGIQVLLQALMNGNTLVYAFDGRQAQLDGLLQRYGVTHISATATYYRSVLTGLAGPYPAVRRVTFGGEPFDEQAAQLAMDKFPHARLTNVYASTEAGSVLSSRDGLFEIAADLEGLVRISDSSELLLHRSLLGLAEALTLEGDWYFTGDSVEFVDGNRFRIAARLSEWIHVGGYKVNPHEVEACLQSVPGIVELVAKPRANSLTGHIVALEVVMAPGTDEKGLKAAIKQYAASRLQPWKVPRIIEIVQQISLSRSTKKVRR